MSLGNQPPRPRQSVHLLGCCGVPDPAGHSLLLLQRLLNLLHLRTDDRLAVRLPGIFVVVILVVRLGLVEFFQRHDLRDDRRLEVRLRLQLGFLGGQLLRLAAVKNDRAVLRAAVRALAVQRGGIVGVPEIAQQFLVGNFLRVKLDLDDLGVAGVAAANLMVGRIFGVPAGVAAGDGEDAGQPLKDRFRTPEAAATHRGKFRVVRFHSLRRGD